MAHRIKLTIAQPTRVAYNGRDTFRVQVTASDGENMPNEIFGHKQWVSDYETNELCDEFCFICSPYDISTYPANEPDPEQVPPYFRKATLDIYVPGTGAAGTVIQAIETQVCGLVALLDQLDVLDNVQVAWCPSAPDDDSSDSSESI